MKFNKIWWHPWLKITHTHNYGSIKGRQRCRLSLRSTASQSLRVQTPHRGTAQTHRGDEDLQGYLSIFTKSRVSFLVGLNPAHIPLILSAFWSQDLGGKIGKRACHQRKFHNLPCTQSLYSSVYHHLFCEAKWSWKRHSQEGKRESW